MASIDALSQGDKDCADCQYELKMNFSFSLTSSTVCDNLFYLWTVSIKPVGRLKGHQ